jgi:hypothetical protein
MDPHTKRSLSNTRRAHPRFDMVHVHRVKHYGTLFGCLRDRGLKHLFFSLGMTQVQEGRVGPALFLSSDVHLPDLDP